MADHGASQAQAQAPRRQLRYKTGFTNVVQVAFLGLPAWTAPPFDVASLTPHALWLFGLHTTANGMHDNRQ
jgi:hypothetical protein